MGLFDIFKTKQYKNEINQLRQKLDELGADDYLTIKRKTSDLEKLFAEKEDSISELNNVISDLQKEEEKLRRNNKTQANKLAKSKELVKAIDYTFENYLNYEPSQNAIKLDPTSSSYLDEISPSVMLKLHCMDIKDLRKAFRDNDKQINLVLDKYASRYTTKTNRAIYKLMVIALRAELQNVLYNLKYEKLETSIDDIKAITKKYLSIAYFGNQSISGTLTKFIGEIEYLFINAVKIEYNYYVK